MSKPPIQVLLIEDKLEDANLIKFALKTSDVNFNVTWVESFSLAKQTLIHSIFDVLVLDLSLPESTELETLKVAQNIVGDTPIIVMTNHTNSDFAINIEEQGASDYIIKGNFDHLAKTIRCVLLQAELTVSHKKLEAANLSLNLMNAEKMELQQRDKMLREQIAHMQKVDSIGEMTSCIAHDFNNILTIISGFTTLASHFNQQSDAESTIPCLVNVQVATNRAIALVKKMLSFCRKSIAQTDSTIHRSKIVEEITNINDLLRAGISSEISFQLINMLNDDSAILLDSIDLHQVVTNLIVNARDAIELSPHKNGLITVSLFHDSITNNDTFCSCCRKKLEGDFISIGISDTGTGIRADQIEHIFDSFFTTKEIGKGTGLGLSVVSRIVHDAKGHIIVDSTLGVGTTFYLLFLQNCEDIYEKEIVVLANNNNENNANLLNLNICVVDNNDDICALFSQELKLLGYTVEAFNSSLMAWENFQNQPNYFDVILTDYAMPYATGLDLAKSMSAIRPSLLIFICTGTKQLNRFDLPTGNIVLLKKPVFITVVDEMIRKNFSSKK